MLQDTVKIELQAELETEYQSNRTEAMHHKDSRGVMTDNCSSS